MRLRRLWNIDNNRNATTEWRRCNPYYFVNTFCWAWKTQQPCSSWQQRCSSLLLYPVQRHFNLLSCPFTLWMTHIYIPCLSCLKDFTSFFNLSLPLHLLWFIVNLTSLTIRDHRLHLDSPGQSVMERAGVLNALCTVYMFVIQYFCCWEENRMLCRKLCW
jgi:hypothetical protein